MAGFKSVLIGKGAAHYFSLNSFSKTVGCENPGLARLGNDLNSDELVFSSPLLRAKSALANRVVSYALAALADQKGRHCDTVTGALA